MLSLIVINPQNFGMLKTKLCQSMMTQEQGMKMQEALTDLMLDVEMNLSGKNRDRFTQRVQPFHRPVFQDPGTPAFQCPVGRIADRFDGIQFRSR